MADWLSPEWAAEVAGLCRLLPEAPGAEGTVALSLSAAPRKEIGIHWRYQHGQVVSAGSGPPDAADLTLSLAAVDGADLLAGRVEPSVAFMRGRLKASGDGGLLLAFLESTTSSGYARWREGVAALAAVP